MTYYDETGNILDSSAIDLDLGWLEPKDTVQHDAVTHWQTVKVSDPVTGKTYDSGYTVIDTPAYTEVTSQIYKLYADHPSDLDLLTQRVSDLEDAAVELAAMAADNEDAIVELASLAGGDAE